MVSIIVPVYNSKDTLVRCINSIVVQSFKDFECILIDDGSTDGSADICDTMKEKDSRIKVVHEENKGVSRARNVGLDLAGGEYIMFVDSDDWIHPQMLEFMYRALKETEVNISVCRFVEVKNECDCMLNDCSALYNMHKMNVENAYLELHGEMTVPWCKLFKASCFRNIRFPEGKIHEDEYVIYRILFEMAEVAVVEEKLYAYYYNPNGITKCKWSPRRLDVLGAYEEQMAYFKSNGYELAFRRQCKMWLVDLCSSIQIIRKDKKYYADKELLKILIKKGRKHLKVYRHDLKLNFEDDIWIYEVLYPECITLLGYCSAIKHRKESKNN